MTLAVMTADGKKGNRNGNGNGNSGDGDGDAGTPGLGGVLGTFFRNDCGIFRRNFLAGLTTPAQACQRFNPRRARGFKRSDRAACLRAIQLSQTALLKMFPPTLR